MNRSTAILSSLTAIALALSGTAALAGQKKESGSFDAAYVKRAVQSIAEGHILILTEATGVNKGGGVDGFSVSCREIADLDKGNGSNSGYCLFVKGGDEQTVKIGGPITTVMKDGHPNTTVTGKWVVVRATGALAGSKGEGTYAGYLTAEDKYHIDWKGLPRWRVNDRKCYQPQALLLLRLTTGSSAIEPL